MTSFLQLWRNASRMGLHGESGFIQVWRFYLVLMWKLRHSFVLESIMPLQVACGWCNLCSTLLWTPTLGLIQKNDFFTLKCLWANSTVLLCALKLISQPKSVFVLYINSVWHPQKKRKKKKTNTDQRSSSSQHAAAHFPFLFLRPEKASLCSEKGRGWFTCHLTPVSLSGGLSQTIRHCDNKSSRKPTVMSVRGKLQISAPGSRLFSSQLCSGFSL